MKVGVLALQGDVPEHTAALERILPPGSVTPVRTPKDLERVVALFLPGGESTTIGRLLAESGLDAAIPSRVAGGLPVLATCAGLILLAREIEASPGGKDPIPLGLLDVMVRRNDYGPQRESFEGPVEVEGLATPFPGVFIRAPRIVSVGAKATPVARRDGQVVGVREGKVWGLTFHPELAADPRLHARFLGATLGFPQNASTTKSTTAATTSTAPASTAAR